MFVASLTDSDRVQETRGSRSPPVVAPSVARSRAPGGKALRPSAVQVVPVSRVDDPAEREADRAAEVHGAGAETSWGSAGGSAPGGGRPLPGPVRSYLEPRFRHDFARVRIHDDDRAARMSRALGAAAFTFGDDVFFARGRFSPGDRAGMRLLTHELAHVVQQHAAGMARVQRQTDGPGAPQDPFARVPRTGWYKSVPNNPWGGLPESLYPDSPDDFMSLTVIEIDVDQMARIRFDAETMQSKSSGERRLRHQTEWTSMFIQMRAEPGLPTLAQLEAEHERLRKDVLGQIGGIKKPALRGVLKDRIHVVLPPWFGGRQLRRSDRLPPPEYLHEERLMWILLRGSSG